MAFTVLPLHVKVLLIYAFPCIDNTKKVITVFLFSIYNYLIKVLLTHLNLPTWEYIKECTFYSFLPYLFIAEVQSPNICTIDYQIFAINTVEKSCGFNHGEIKNKELVFLTLFYSVSNSKIVLDAIMLPNGVSIFQVKLGTIRKIRVKIKLKRSIATIFIYYILQTRGIIRNFAIELQ